MPFIKSINYFFKKRADTADRTLLYLVALNVVFGAIFILLNHIEFHYPDAALFGMSTRNWLIAWNGFFWKAIAPSLVFFFYGIYIRTESPRASTFLWGIGFFSLCVFANMMITNAIQATPFSPIDPLLVKIDRFMGIDTPALMTWTHNHPSIHNLFVNAYYSLIIELMGTLLILTVFSARKPLTIFYLAQLSTILVGALIYYFFPTMAPSGVFIHCPYFTATQKDTSLKFYQLHHFLKVTVTDDCGLIAFPSFHVVWAILLTNCYRDIKIVFYPAAIWNAVIIVSTIFLGWHYFADVIGGAVLAIAGIVFAEWIYRRALLDK